MDTKESVLWSDRGIGHRYAGPETPPEGRRHLKIGKFYKRTLFSKPGRKIVGGILGVGGLIAAPFTGGLTLPLAGAGFGIGSKGGKTFKHALTGGLIGAAAYGGIAGGTALLGGAAKVFGGGIAGGGEEVTEGGPASVEGPPPVTSESPNPTPRGAQRVMPGAAMQAGLIGGKVWVIAALIAGPILYWVFRRR